MNRGEAAGRMAGAGAWLRTMGSEVCRVQM